MRALSGSHFVWLGPLEKQWPVAVAFLPLHTFDVELCFGLYWQLDVMSTASSWNYLYSSPHFQV